VHDLHPDYASTRYALRRQEQSDIRALAVQHHHAHMASCMAEHGLTEPAIGVCFDGTGFGTDGAIWGGEILVGDLRRFRRAAHLRYVPLPGADKAIREPWRMALAHLLDAGSESISLTRRVDVASMQTVRQMIERRFNTPLTSSAGRLFDAIASLIGIRDRVSFEGQAAMQLEDLAEGSCENGAYSFDFFTPAKSPADPAPMTIDTRPMIREVLDDLNRGVTPGMIARRFHTTIAHLIVETCQKLREQCGLNRIFLSGGVFMNGLLLRDTVRFLRERDFLPFHHRIIPPNDGGISFGQLAVAVAQPSTGTQAIP
jgi:hydrogenase maturation protein HypF